MNFLTKIKNRSKGFTLVELMVVMAIIGVVVALSTSAYQGAKVSSRDAKRKADLEDIRAALEIYRSDCGTYPSTLSFGGTLIGSGAGGCLAANTYMSQVPQDPKGYSYGYNYNSTTKRYTLCSVLENGSGTGTNCGGSGGSNCGDATNLCRHSVTSP